MRVFVENPPDPLREWEEKHVVPIGVWPIRHRHADAVAGYQSAYPQQNQSERDNQEGEEVNSAGRRQVSCACSFHNFIYWNQAWRLVGQVLFVVSKGRDSCRRALARRPAPQALLGLKFEIHFRGFTILHFDFFFNCAGFAVGRNYFVFARRNIGDLEGTIFA